MSLHWTLIAGFLYAEIATVLIFLLPFVSNSAWNKLFKSRFLKGLENQLIYYFYVLVAILVLFFLGKETISPMGFHWRLSFCFRKEMSEVRLG